MGVKWCKREEVIDGLKVKEYQLRVQRLWVQDWQFLCMGAKTSLMNDCVNFDILRKYYYCSVHGSLQSEHLIYLLRESCPFYWPNPRYHDFSLRSVPRIDWPRTTINDHHQQFFSLCAPPCIWCLVLSDFIFVFQL